MVLTPGSDLTDTESSVDDAMNEPKPSLINQLKKPTNVDDSQESQSPAKKPTKGGEFGFVKVSRIASIEVKDAGRDQEFYANPVRTIQAATPKSPSGQRDKRSTKGRLGGKSEMEPTGKKIRHEVEADESSSDEDIIPDNDPMDVIEVSPYEGNANAEREVKLFEDLKNLLTAGSIKASRIFGPSNAEILVRSYAEIDQSGMVYSQEWVDGIMRGSNVGVLPKDLLLLCLISSRLVKVDEFLMAGLTRDLEVFKIIKEAVQVWDLEDEYKRIAGTSNSLKNFTFNGKRRHCFKCEIFVARAYSCYKAFGSKGSLEKSSMAKVRKCLDIMESRLPEPKEKANKKRKKSMEKPTTVKVPVMVPLINKKQKKGMEKPATVKDPVMAPLVDDPQPVEDPQPKKKRGRPPKNRQLTSPKQDPNEVFIDDLDSPGEVMPRRGSSSRPGQTKGRKKEASTTDALLSKFEEQYEEMGKHWVAMGETLSQLKRKLGKERTEREQEIRSELLAEVQKKLTRH